MIWLCFIWFTLLYGAGFYFSPNKDLCNPLRLVSLKYAFFNLPFLLFTALYPESFLKGILSVIDTDVDGAFFKYTLLQTLAYLSLVAGILFFQRKQPNNIQVQQVQDRRRLITYTVVALVVGLGAYVLFLYKIGGLGYLLTHLKDRVALQGGQYVLILLELLPLVMLLLILLRGTNGRKWYTIAVLVALVLFALIFTSFGGRKPTMVLIAVSLAGWHYYVRKIEFTMNNFWVGTFAAMVFVCYILLIPVLRNDKTAHGNKNTVVYTTARNFVYNLSYTYIDVLVANYYNKDNAWYLDGYFEPAKAFYHKGDKSNIPQVDQGVYLKSIYLKQKDFRPPMPRKEVSKTSWPTENFGFAYANFLWVGVVVFFFLQGAIFAWMYKYAMRNVNNVVLLLVYVQFMLQFNFSSLRIAFFLKTLPLYCICWFVFNKFVAPKNRQPLTP